ncbi:MAG: DUF4145 domain-containing protein [Pseudoxanthomonas sp.]|jgi:hypothetical protein|uniref:DUF4145 domain-containing protein n=1 Tax=Pseudoxanthomonas TaxID=83618 RepID=UPI00138A4102|nr:MULTISPECIES: DUF4145 domain-containing protein [Pseudoxanthomonas]KAF1728906.1 hypothetical protein CSC76_02440 [Pseudoxanthomonas mexicana]MCH2090615.1 DUF4145 domain-containing protein [Pseudoxanthomonas sp.]
MAEIVYNCPRCKSIKTTLDVFNHHTLYIEYGWKRSGEMHVVCRACRKGSILVVSQRELEDYIEAAWKAGLHSQKGNVNGFLEVAGHISAKDESSIEPPEHLPPRIDIAFREGATCLSVKCYNAAAAMFRLCLDMATENLLPEGEVAGLNAKVRRSLGLRIEWLFSAGILPLALQDLSNIIKDNGNDGAHEGTVTKEDAEDLSDFTFALLERLFTDPRKIEIARERRNNRHNP